MLARLKILVVDDDQLTLEMIGSVLATEGVEVLGLRDSREAGSLIEKQTFDGIFLDLTMPGMDGLELAKRIRGSLYNATTPIIVITGRSDSAAMKDAFAAGAHFFLSKPLDLRKLRHLVNTTHGTLLRERRRNRLVPLSVEITCRAGSRSFTGMISRISEQGLVCHLDDSPVPGDLVHLTLRLPSSPRALELMSVIVRTEDERNTGCQFKKLADATREAIREYVASVNQG
jgi:CheY-like chemotaxis protein